MSSYMLGNLRVVDLTKLLDPKTETRRCHLYRFNTGGPIPDFHTIMDLTSHLGTHCECPYHHNDDWPSVAELPLDRFMGRAIYVEIPDAEPRGYITPAMLDKYSHKSFELFFTPLQSLPIHKWHDESARAFQNPHSHFDISVQISLGAGHRVGSCRTDGTCRCCPGSVHRSWGRRMPRLPPLQSTGRLVHPEWTGVAIPFLSTPHSDRQTMGDARKESTRPWAEWRAQTSS